MVRLSEGFDYEFFVEKITESPEGNHHFVLKGPDKRKYLIPGKYYEYYNITVGETIVCRVDRINCTGRIFLEPKNPLYTEGCIYTFYVNEHITVTDRKGRRKKVVRVKDIYGNMIEVYPGTESIASEPGTSVDLKIVRISKGRFFLTSTK